MITEYHFAIFKQPARNGVGWFAVLYQSDKIVAHATIKDLDKNSEEIVWFLVGCTHHKQVIGEQLVRRICTYFSDKKVHAKDIVASGNRFWKNGRLRVNTAEESYRSVFIPSIAQIK